MFREVPPDHSETLSPSIHVMRRELEAFKLGVPGANFITQGVSQ